MVPRLLHPVSLVIPLVSSPPGRQLIALTADGPRTRPVLIPHAGIAAFLGVACGTMVDTLLRGNDG